MARKSPEGGRRTACESGSCKVCEREYPLRQHLPHQSGQQHAYDRQAKYIAANHSCCRISRGDNLNARGWIDGKGNLLPVGTDVSQTGTFTTARPGKQDFFSTLRPGADVAPRLACAAALVRESKKNPAAAGFPILPGTKAKGIAEARHASREDRAYFFLAATASLSALPGRNLGTLASAMLISLPVCGFLPVRA